MKNDLPKLNKHVTDSSSHTIPDMETIVRHLQKAILRQASRIPSDNHISIRFVKEFEWSSNWAETIASWLGNDSRFYRTSAGKLPDHHNPDAVFDLYKIENRLSSLPFSELTRAECLRVVERMKHFHLADIDDLTLDAMYDASNWVISESITEENCLRELELTHDSIQRAELYMIMGNDVEAYREFKSITAEESSNPENALALVNLVERYDNPKSAIRILRKWFLLEIVLHALPFDLVFDLLTDRKKTEPSPRTRYLQSLLLKSESMTQKELHNHLMLVMPSGINVKPDLKDIDNRLKCFGLSLESMDLVLDENESVNICALLDGVTDQLLHLADLARRAKKEKLATKSLERAILCCFVLMNLPDDSTACFDGFQTCAKSMVIDEYLDDLNDLMEELFVPPETTYHHRLIEKQIIALGKLARRKVSDFYQEKSDGMPGVPRKHGYH
jgi:hypothetical protein